MKFTRLLSLSALLACATAAHAFDFKSIGSAPAVLYDAPTQKGKKIFVAPRGMPVEVVLAYGEWVKIRDAAGTMAWLEAKSLNAKRNVVVQVANARVRADADDNAALVFTADKGVLLELSEPVASGWVKVKHRDGQGGYVKVAEVWGD